MDELLIPAFKHINITGDVRLSSSDIQAAYGVPGLRDWRTWFEEAEAGHGIGRGGVVSLWRLKLKMAVAARKLLTTVDEATLKYPPAVILAIRNRRAYEAFWREHEKHSAEMAAEHGTSIRPPEPFDPDKNYLKKAWRCRDSGPRASVSDATRGWSELLDGPSNNFSEPYTGFVPEENDIPY